MSVDHTQQLDLLDTAVDVKESPHRQRVIDVHQGSNMVTIAPIMHRSYSTYHNNSTRIQSRVQTSGHTQKT